MVAKLKLSTPLTAIGEVVTIVSSNNIGEIVSNSWNDFVLAGSIQNQADYPALYAQIGLIGATPWISRTSGTTSNINALTYGNGLYVYGGNGGVLATSTDAVTWTSRTSGTTSIIRALTYGNGVYVYAGDGGVLASSTDAITWTTRTSGTTSSYYAMTYGNGKYIAVGSAAGGTGAVISTSTDGTTWSIQTIFLLNGGALYSVDYGNGLYFSGGYVPGYNAPYYTSTDGITWTLGSGITSTGVLGGAAYGNGLYVLIDTGAVTWYTSTNASTWTSRGNFSVDYIKTDIIYNSGAFHAVGYGNGQRVTGISNDAISWVRAGNIETANTPNLAFTLTYGNGRYVIAGNSGILLTSATAIVPVYSNTYNVSVQFLVPSMNTGNRAYSFANATVNADARFINYVRAK